MLCLTKSQIINIGDLGVFRATNTDLAIPDESLGLFEYVDL